MKKWEYEYIEERFEAPELVLTSFLNAKGAQGWELVNFKRLDNGFFNFIFKREVQ